MRYEEHEQIVKLLRGRASAFMVYTRLRWKCNGKSRKFPLRWLVEDLGLSRSTVKRSVQLLVKLKMIAVTPTRGRYGDSKWVILDQLGILNGSKRTLQMVQNEPTPKRSTQEKKKQKKKGGTGVLTLVQRNVGVVVETFPSLEGGWELREGLVTYLGSQYEKLELSQEWKKMRMWLEGQPKRGGSGMTKFVSGWISRGATAQSLPRKVVIRDVRPKMVGFKFGEEVEDGVEGWSAVAGHTEQELP